MHMELFGLPDRCQFSSSSFYHIKNNVVVKWLLLRNSTGKDTNSLHKTEHRTQKVIHQFIGEKK